MKNLPKAWYAIAHLIEIYSKPIKLERLGYNLVLWKDAEKIIAMEYSCPHRGAFLSLGKVCDGDIACRFHGFR
ncbi:Rieske 2Fe-2S domain-containing protein, partial [Francisella tularensis]|uniref:Rieske 2Fe-2S domain-containing protein n=1 Tax=Francisella tularensis TaxID=263 RepID=UPI0023819C13